MMEAGDKGRKRFEVSRLLALKMEERVTSQGILQPPKAGKGREMGPRLSLLAESNSADTWILGLLTSRAVR